MYSLSISPYRLAITEVQSGLSYVSVDEKSGHTPPEEI